MINKIEINENKPNKVILLKLAINIFMRRSNLVKNYLLQKKWKFSEKIKDLEFFFNYHKWSKVK